MRVVTEIYNYLQINSIEIFKNSSQFIQLSTKLTYLDNTCIFTVVLISHARFVEHFLVKIFGVGVYFIIFCCVGLDRDLVYFCFRIVVIVNWLEW